MISDFDAEEHGVPNGAIHSSSNLSFGGDFLCQSQNHCFLMGFSIGHGRTIQLSSHHGCTFNLVHWFAGWTSKNGSCTSQSKMIFDDVMEILPEHVTCIDVGAIARRCAPYYLGGMGKTLLHDVNLPHPSKIYTGRMWPWEHDNLVDICCVIVSEVSGQDITHGNIKDLPRVLDCSGGTMSWHMNAEEMRQWQLKLKEEENPVEAAARNVERELNAAERREWIQALVKNWTRKDAVGAKER